MSISVNTSRTRLTITSIVLGYKHNVPSNASSQDRTVRRPQPAKVARMHGDMSAFRIQRSGDRGRQTFGCDSLSPFVLSVATRSVAKSKDSSTTRTRSYGPWWVARGLVSVRAIILRARASVRSSRREPGSSHRLRISSGSLSRS